ncbi:MAG: hypothetical protein HYX50_05110 [Chloroflexi bacterium]|nr:hypothetical protein [Chloroflexota bacterium]
MALANDRRYTPAFAGAAPVAPARAYVTGVPAARPLSALRGLIAKHLALAALFGAAIIALVASVPAMTALASNLRAGDAPAPRAAYGPTIDQRAAAGVAGNWEQSASVSAPTAGQMGAALMAGAAQQQALEDGLRALGAQMAADEAAAQQAADASAAGSAASAGAAAPYSANAASGFAPGTTVSARVTIYGCTGPGGGFCNAMSSGGAPFEGAAACSGNLPTGTRLTIAGDPTGRVYECLDRGSLSPTWIDVFFYDTNDGMAWQSSLGGTVADITIVN